MPIRELSRQVVDRSSELDVVLDGFCPVHGKGTIGGRRVFFSAGRKSWRFAVSHREEVDPMAMTSSEHGFYIEEPYQGKARSAGWMTLSEAQSLVLRCADACVDAERRRRR